ncbi:MAG: (Fe-S)-binding protein, partial [Oscillospiraceae bacterium]|nr:(Fe-S)-binding protein [Oscillospiraceae bacterium]
MSVKDPVAGKDGNRYVPFEERTGENSVVFFTRDLSEEGLKKIYDRVCSVLEGRVAVKLHTGEAEGPNIIPRPWVKELFASRLKNATIIETNTYYEGSRYTT